MKKLSIRDMTLCAMFTVLIAVGAFIKIPVPVVPFTLQFFFTMMAGLMLGGRLGAISVSIYALLGLIGLPIFAEGGGIWYLLKPSFGYIIGFIIGTYITGKIIEKKGVTRFFVVLSANLAGLLVVYAVGMIYYYIICNFVIMQPIAVWPLFLYCFILAVPGDLVLCILAAIMIRRIKPVLNR